jgi:tripartite-type tricarboxylate transporter receptor subunit TctC
MLKMMAGIDIIHVPYKGTAQIAIDLAAGQIDSGFPDLVVAIPQIKAGKVRALAVTDDRRVDALPEVPTMIEAGLHGYTGQLWWAVMAPKGTPSDVVSRLNGELARIAKLPDVLERYQALGLTPAHNTPQQLADLIKTDAQQMGKILKAAGVKPE